MLTIGKMALTIATGGILLGALLGEAADPVMKRAPEPSWGHVLRGPETDTPNEAEAFLAEFDPFMGPDSYAPTWADEAAVDWEPHYPSWTYSDFSVDMEFSEEFSDIAEGGQPEPTVEPLASEDLPSPEPQVVPPASAAAPADGLAPLY